MSHRSWSQRKFASPELKETLKAIKRDIVFVMSYYRPQQLLRADLAHYAYCHPYPEMRVEMSSKHGSLRTYSANVVDVTLGEVLFRSWLKRPDFAPAYGKE